MTQCNMCGNDVYHSMFASRFGLCSSCYYLASWVIQNKGKIITHSIGMIENAKTLETRLSHCDILLENTKTPLKYENRGILTISECSENPGHVLLASDF